MAKAATRKKFAAWNFRVNPSKVGMTWGYVMHEQLNQTQTLTSVLHSQRDSDIQHNSLILFPYSSFTSISPWPSVFFLYHWQSSISYPFAVICSLSFSFLPITFVCRPLFSLLNITPLSLARSVSSWSYPFKLSIPSALPYGLRIPLLFPSLLGSCNVIK